MVQVRGSSRRPAQPAAAGGPRLVVLTAMAATGRHPLATTEGWGPNLARIGGGAVTPRRAASGRSFRLAVAPCPPPVRVRALTGGPVAKAGPGPPRLTAKTIVPIVTPFTRACVCLC